MRNIEKYFAAAVSTLVLLCIIIRIFIWLTPGPSKSLEISVLWTPPFPESTKNEAEYDPLVDGREHIVYRIYYAWEHQRQDLPWWIVTNAIDGRWRIIEAANSDNYSTKPEDNAIFDEKWIGRFPKGGFGRIQRTRLQKFQLLAFGTNHAFSEEKEALKTVQKIIKVEEDFQRQGKDLFDAMSAYMKSHPELGTFWPPSRNYFDEQIEQLQQPANNLPPQQAE